MPEPAAADVLFFTETPRASNWAARGAASELSPPSRWTRSVRRAPASTAFFFGLATAAFPFAPVGLGVLLTAFANAL
jgi:hypothetical protein